MASYSRLFKLAFVNLPAVTTALKRVIIVMSAFTQPPFSNSDEFDSYAACAREQGFTHVPIARQTLADLDTPVSTYLKLADLPYTYLFESVHDGSKWGRYSIIGLPCDRVYRFYGNEFTLEEKGEIIEKRTEEHPLQTVRLIQSEYKVSEYQGLPEMIGGLVGYFGYETVGYIEPRSIYQQKPDSIATPDILLMVSLNVLVFDNLSGRIFIVTLADLNDSNAYRNAQIQLDQWAATLADNLPLPTAPNINADNNQQESASDDAYNLHFDKADFMRAVERCHDYIRDGDIMQVVLSQRLSQTYTGPPTNIYRALRTINPSPYMYFLNLGDFHIVGSSPEILVRLRDGKVTVRPIAGTRKRGKNEEQDKQLEQELLNDEKELAEHLMLIDLGRNDVGRIAKVGSVELTEKMLIERYSHVMHIVSNVDGQIDSELDAIDVLKATFPAGTVSGAPKIRAMEIINELEPVKRGVYSGAIGYLGWNGQMDTAIAIRTAVIKDGIINIQAGAGIVADSVPKHEWNETLNKARAMLAAVDMANTGLEV